MSASAALQVAIVDLLLASPDAAAMLGGRVYDNPVPSVAYPYLSFGPSQELEDDADCLEATECFQQLDIWTQEGGSQLSAKVICAAVRKALLTGPIVLAQPYVLVFVEADIRVMGDPDDRIAHGIVSLRALIEH